MSFEVEKAEDGRYVLNVKGLVCPYPLLLVLKTIENMGDGELLEVLTDNPPSVESILQLEKKGHKVLELSKLEDGNWKLTLRKGG